MDGRQLPPEFLDCYSGSTSRLPQTYPLDDSKALEAPVVPAKSIETKPQEVPWYNPRGWSPRQRLWIISAIVVIIVVVIVGAVEGIKANRYPDYTPLNYQLRDTYAGPSFFDHFNYFSDEDPTNGFVVYVDEKTARDLKLTYTTNTSAVLRVDSFTPNIIDGRSSVRIESKNTYDTGLFIFDIIHTPYGCGTWPALWLTDGYNWPNNGEIDILESNNEGSNGNEVTLHTTPGCSMNVKRKETGDAVFKTCDNSTNGNSGCGVRGDPSSYGEAFNANGGGVSRSLLIELPSYRSQLDTNIIRSMPLNSVKQVSEPGSSPVVPFRPT